MFAIIVEKSTMKTTIILTFLLFISLKSGAQNFDNIKYKQAVNVAYELAINHQKFEDALKTLDHVESTYHQLYGEDYLLKAYCFKSMKKDTLAALALKQGWSLPTFDMRTMWYVSAIAYAISWDGFNEYQKSLVQAGFDNNAKIPRPYRDSLHQVIERMTNFDHLCRDENYKDTTNVYWQNAIDSSNLAHQAFFENIVKTLGFPGERLLGGYDYDIWFILVHTAGNEAFYQRMKPIFLEEVRKGNMSPFMFATWVDQHQFYNRLPNIYNTPNANQIKLTPEQLAAVEKARFEIGLLNVPLVLPNH